MVSDKLNKALKAALNNKSAKIKSIDMEEGMIKYTIPDAIVEGNDITGELCFLKEELPHGMSWDGYFVARIVEQQMNFSMERAYKILTEEERQPGQG